MRPSPATTHLLATAGTLALALAAAFALPVPAHAWTITIGGSDGTVGSGKVVAVSRPATDVGRLRLTGSIDVDARPGNAPAIIVHGDDNIVPLIDTLAEGDTLVVRAHPGAEFVSRSKLWVEVVFTHLLATTQSGSGDLHVRGVHGDGLESSISGSGDLQIDGADLKRFAIDIAGSGDLKMDGHSDDARFSVAGSGDIDAGDLRAKHVVVRVSGSGDAHVNASESLDARVAGSGDVTYAGSPRDVTRHVSGSGSVKPD